MLFPSFKRNIAENTLVHKGDRIVLAVSGGIDSMVLLDLFDRLSAKLAVGIEVAHVNHGLRGTESDADEALVRAAAKEYGMPCRVLKKKPPKGTNVQNAARETRLKFFGRVAKETGSNLVAMAHHLDDQAETVMSHLLRGSGLKGLAGMRPVSKIGNLTVIRPLLEFSKSEIAEYAVRRGIAFREDSTNASAKYSRNSIRHRLMPVLLEFNPKIARHLASMAVCLGDDEEALDKIAWESLKSVLLEERRESLSFSRPSYILLPRALRLRTLRKAFWRASGSTKDLNSDQLGKMDHISTSDRKGASYRLPSRWRFEREGDVLVLRRCRTSCDRKRT